MVCDLSRLNSRQMLAPAMALALAISCFVAPEGLAEEKGLKATSKVASQPRAKVLEQLAVKLQQQRRDLEISNNPISKANLAKLHPALQRQKMILLSRKVLAVDPNSKTVLASSASDSDLVVGSIKPANAAPQKVHPLARFYRSLNALKSKSKAKQITVLHIAPEGSDSAQFANNIRTGLNDIYGDAGHGMVSPAHSSRQSGRDGHRRRLR